MKNDYESGRRHGASGGGYIPGMGEGFNAGRREGKWQKDYSEAIDQVARRNAAQARGKTPLSLLLLLGAIGYVAYEIDQGGAIDWRALVRTSIFWVFVVAVITVPLVTAFRSARQNGNGLIAAIKEALRRYAIMLATAVFVALSFCAAVVTAVFGNFARALLDGSATGAAPGLWVALSIMAGIVSLGAGYLAARGLSRRRWVRKVGIALSLALTLFLFFSAADERPEVLVQDLLGLVGLTL